MRLRLLTVVSVMIVSVTACSGPVEPTPSFTIAPTTSGSDLGDAVTAEPSPSSETTRPSPSPEPDGTWVSVTSHGGAWEASVPQRWQFDSTATSQRSELDSVLDVVGVWRLAGNDGDYTIVVEADKQGSPPFTAKSYFDAFFSFVDSGIAAVQSHEFYTAADGSEALWVELAPGSGAEGGSDVAFFVFSDSQITAGRVSSPGALDSAVIAELREMSRVVVAP